MAKVITQEKLVQLAGKLLAGGERVIAPARVDGLVAYKALASPQEMLPESEYVLPRTPFKEFFFPRTECILRYQYDEKNKVRVESPALDSFPSQVILGCRPCDAASLPILDQVFGWDYKDQFYFKRREKTTVVTIACSRHEESCRCTSMGYAPDHSSGSDMLLKKVGTGRYLAETLTDKGRALLEKHKELFEEISETPAAQVTELKAAFDIEKIKPWLEKHFDDALWLEIAAKCMGCGTCAFGCPTCHCFDIVDEGDLKGGRRLKNWDTCAACAFTVHGSGHNPRSSQEQRYRQRVMHKFKYYVDKFNLRACTGCGRCTSRCPAGLDLMGVLQSIAKQAEP